MGARSGKYEYIVTPFSEWVSKISGLSYPVFWVLFSLVLFCVYFSACYLLEQPGRPLLVIVVLSFLPACISIAVIWFSKALEDLTDSMYMFIKWSEEKVLEWHKSELKAIFDLKRMVLVGSGLLAFSLYRSFPTSLSWKFESIPEIIFIVMRIATSFLGGAMFYVMIRAAKMIHKMGNLEKIRVPIYQHPLTGIKCVGNLYSRFALVAVGIYLFGILPCFFEKGVKASYLVEFFFGAFVVFFFIYAHIEFHKIMSKEKHKQLSDFSKRIEKALEVVISEPSEGNVKELNELYEVEKSLNGMREWPFDTRFLVMIVTGVAFPLMVALLKMVLNILIQSGKVE